MIEILSIIGVGVSTIGILGSFMFYMFNRMENKMESIDQDIKTAHRRMDGLYQTLQNNIQTSNERMDSLYQTLQNNIQTSNERMDSLYQTLIDMVKK